MNEEASAAAPQDEPHEAEEFELLKEDLARLRADMQALKEHLASLGGKRTAEAREAASAKLEALRAELDRLGEELGLQGRQVRRTLEQKVREQPVVSLLTAFGLGFLLSRLFERR